MNNAETTDKVAAVAEQGAPVAPEKGGSKKGASPKKGAPKAKKSAKPAKAAKALRGAKKGATEDWPDHFLLQDLRAASDSATPSIPGSTIAIVRERSSSCLEATIRERSIVGDLGTTGAWSRRTSGRPTLRYQARMVSGLATQATSRSALRPSRFPISARLIRSGLERRNRAGSLARRTRFSAARYSFRDQKANGPELRRYMFDA